MFAGERSTTGLGDAVAQLVEKKYSGLVRRFVYSPSVKYQLVLKTQHVLAASIKYTVGGANAKSDIASELIITNR